VKLADHVRMSRIHEISRLIAIHCFSLSAIEKDVLDIQLVDRSRLRELENCADNGRHHQGAKGLIIVNASLYQSNESSSLVPIE
jgi:hypothetical protein